MAIDPIAGMPADWFLWAALGSVVKLFGSEASDTVEHFSVEGRPSCASVSLKGGVGDIESK
jgi:hypothetical protein